MKHRGRMNKFKTTVDINETQRVAKIIGANLKEFNESQVGPYEFKPFTIHITNDSEDIIGGLTGDIFDKICLFQLLWVHENERQKGLGTELFKKLEEFARNNGCEIIQLKTAEFQAKQFYEKMGFTVVATLPNSFKGYTGYFMRMNLI